MNFNTALGRIKLDILYFLSIHFLFSDACYYMSSEEVTAYTAAAKCGMMGGSRLASVVTIEELTAITADLPPNLNHWMGMHITGQDYLVISDGRRELSQSYFGTDLRSSASTSCPDCTCIHIGADGKLMEADCTETRPFICEFKGEVYIGFCRRLIIFNN